MADDNAATSAEIDVDALDDAQFAELKGKMVAETTAEPTTDAGDDKSAQQAVEQTNEQAQQDDDPDPKAETVPHGQFHRERERRKQAETRAQELERNFSVLTERVNQLMSLQQQPVQAPEQEQPSGPPKGDPVALLEWLAERVQQQEQQNVAYAQQAQQESGRQAFASRLQQAEQGFRQANPDYDEALAYVAENRDAELQLLYPMSTPDQRRFYMLQEWSGMAAASFEAGRNPAEQIYNLAKSRGYAKAAPVPQNNVQNAVAEIAKREEARQASMSLGSTGGGVANTGQVTPEQLLDMSDSEFEAYKQKHGGSIARAFQ